MRRIEQLSEARLYSNRSFFLLGRPNQGQEVS